MIRAGWSKLRSTRALKPDGTGGQYAVNALAGGERDPVLHGHLGLGRFDEDVGLSLRLSGGDSRSVWCSCLRLGGRKGRSVDTVHLGLGRGDLRRLSLSRSDGGLEWCSCSRLGRRERYAVVDADLGLRGLDDKGSGGDGSSRLRSERLSVGDGHLVLRSLSDGSNGGNGGDRSSGLDRSQGLSVVGVHLRLRRLSSDVSGSEGLSVGGGDLNLSSGGGGSSLRLNAVGGGGDRPGLSDGLNRSGSSDGDSFGGLLLDRNDDGSGKRGGSPD